MILSLCTGTHRQPNDLPLDYVLLIFLDCACCNQLIFVFLVSLKQFANEVARIDTLNWDLQVQVEDDVDQQVFVYQEDAVIQNLHDALIHSIAVDIIFGEFLCCNDLKEL